MTGRIQLTDDPSRFPRPFGHYLLLAPLGKGGMGEVFMAKRRTSQAAELCVVKMLRAELVKNREYVVRFVDEANVVVRLNHTNICHVFDVGKTAQNQIYLAMEYLSGVDAKTLCERAFGLKQGVGVNAALQIGIDILAALHHAHTRTDPKTGALLQLIHRDVSPHNVMIGYDGVSKLIDFGLASSTMKMEQTAPNVVMGKMAYMGPEQARGDATDATADQFAAAMVIYELLAGERFYEGLSGNEVWHTVGHGGFRPRRFKLIDRPLRTILNRALSTHPSKRYPSCDDFRNALLKHQQKLKQERGTDAVRRILRALMGEELEAEWERLAGFAEISLSGFTAELEALPPEHTIAQAAPGAGPVREHLPPPPPQAASPSDPTAVLHTNEVAHEPTSPSAPFPATSSLESSEATELLSGRRRGAGRQSDRAQTPVTPSAHLDGATEIVRRDHESGVARQMAPHGVKVVPSGSMPGPQGKRRKVLTAGLAGVLALSLIMLGALLVTVFNPSSDVPTLSEPQSVAAEAPRSPSQKDNISTRQASTSTSTSTAAGEKARADDKKQAIAPETAIRDVPAKVTKAGSPQTARSQDAARDASGLAEKSPAGPRRPGRARKGKTASVAQPRTSLVKQAEAPERKEKERTSRPQTQAPGAQKKSNEARIARGKAKLARSGYPKASGYPRAVKKMYEVAQKDLQDNEAAKRFERAANKTPPRAAPSTTKPPTAPFDYRARLKNLVRQCLKSHACAKELSKQLGAIKAISNRSNAANRKLQRDIVMCETKCGVR